MTVTESTTTVLLILFSVCAVVYGFGRWLQVVEKRRRNAQPFNILMGNVGSQPASPRALETGGRDPEHASTESKPVEKESQ